MHICVELFSHHHIHPKLESQKPSLTKHRAKNLIEIYQCVAVMWGY